MSSGPSLLPARQRPAEPGSPFRSIRERLTALGRRAGGALRSSPLHWEVAAFVGAMLVYAITRLWSLEKYPIYFFSDEAFQPIAAEELLQRGFRDSRGRLFPIYFANGGAWAPLLPVWAHVVSVGLFGKSVEVARATAAVVSLIGAAAIALVLRFGFRNPLWWIAPLVIAVMPAHFLHSRTTFETTFSVSFFAGFVLFYVLYRCRSPWFLYPAILFGALTFYSYSVGQLVLAVAVVLLAIVDVRYHVRHWRHVLAGILLVAIAAVPLYRFRRAEPQAAAGQLRRVSSYWVERIPFPQKLRKAAKSYGSGLSPKYWFFPNEKDLSRHRMAGYSYLPKAFLPFVVVGLGLCVWRIRSPPHRTVLVCLLATPAAAAVTAHGITRSLSFVVPATILAVLGTGTLLQWVRARWARSLLSAAAFLVLSVASLRLLNDALTHGPLWFRDYQWGQQWGARQIFEIIPGYLKADPSARLKLTSEWANGPDLYPRFFFPRGSEEAARVEMGNVTDFSPEQMATMSPEKLTDQIESLSRTIYVMTPEELEVARRSDIISGVRVDRVLEYPDGRPGFYFVRLSLSPKVHAAVAKGREQLHELVSDPVVMGGDTVLVRHSRIDIGRLEDVVDGNPASLARFNAANPAVMELHFPRPRPIRAVALTLGSGTWEIRAELRPGENDPGRTYFAARPDSRDPTIEIAVDRGPRETVVLKLEIRQVGLQEFAVIHLRELQLR